MPSSPASPEDNNDNNKSLSTYLNQVDESRADFKCSLDLTQFLLAKNQQEQDDANKSGAPLLAPFSELHRATQLYHVALDDSRWSTSQQQEQQQQQQQQQQQDKPLGPEALVGKILQLFCPLDQGYHIGRILDWRLASHHRAPFFGQDRIASSEFLVRWVQKKDGRILHWWIVLEEHAVAVGIALVYAKKGHKSSPYSKWKPGFLLLRSALEVVPWRRDIIEQGSWGLISFLEGRFGDETFSKSTTSVAYLDLDKDVVDLLSTTFRDARKHELKIQREANRSNTLVAAPTGAGAASTKMIQSWKEDSVQDHNIRRGIGRVMDSSHTATNTTATTSTTSPLTKKKKKSGDSFTLSKTCIYEEQDEEENEDVVDPMVMIELEEQRRIFYWHTLPLVQSHHPMALRILDESMLPPLQIIPDSTKRMNVDRLWLSQLVLAQNPTHVFLSNDKEQMTLDEMASITLSPVSSIPKAMASLK